MNTMRLLRHLNLAVIALILPLALLSGASHAQQAADSENQPQSHVRWYQVEMIVFSRASTTSQEQWPVDVKLSYPESLVSLKADGGGSDGFTMLPASERLLNSQAATLAKSGSYTLLFHQAWRQMIQAPKTNILITGGHSFNDHQELEGNISLSVGQFLKLQTNLWLTQFVPAGTPVTEAWPELPSLPNALATEADKPQEFLIKRIVKISQQRSMRSNEVHYIDHPLLGIIIKIIPYDLPAPKL